MISGIGAFGRLLGLDEVMRVGPYDRISARISKGKEEILELWASKQLGQDNLRDPLLSDRKNLSVWERERDPAVGLKKDKAMELEVWGLGGMTYMTKGQLGVHGG